MPDRSGAVPLRSGRTSKWWILANVSVGTFMATLDGSIANVGLPTISATFHVSVHVVQWVVTAYLLTICAMLPIVGKLSDLLGRGRLYNTGFLIFSVGSALCGLSASVGMLIGMRVLQAIGASLLMANSQGIVATTFGPRERGRAMGITGAMVSLGSLSGPAVGGVLIDHFGWPVIFWINVPIGVIGFLAGLFILPSERSGRPKEPFDYLGSGLFVVSVTTLLYTVSNAETRGWTTLPTLAGLAIAAVASVLFYFRETRTEYPMMDFSLYRIGMFATGSVAAFFSFVSLFCVNVMMPFYLQNVLRVPPAVTGYVMAAYPLTMAVVAPIAGWLSDKIGPYLLTTGGLLLNTAGFVSLNLLSSAVSPWVVAAHLAVFGLGHGMFQSSNNSSLMGSVPRSKVGIAGGLNALTRNMGMVFGVSLSVSLFSFRLHQLTGQGVWGHVTLPVQAFMGALHTVFWTAAGICLAGAVVSSLRSKYKGTGSV
ncbi:MAG: MFS transporter [Alicyclobacillaceae bacterium]|nr:MFS transporter [Alicyclobacillaceae bacterium]